MYSRRPHYRPITVIWAHVLAAIIIFFLALLAHAQSVTLTLPVPPSTQPTNLVVSITTQPTTQPSPVTPTPTPPSPQKMALGTNVCANDYINGAAQWSDVTHQCTSIFNTGTPGVQAAFTYLFGTYPSGNYQLTYQGPQNGVSIVGKSFTPVSDGSGGWKASVPFNNADRVEFRFPTTNPSTNVRLMSPDAVPGQMYRTDYLKLLAPYNCIRLMPMERVNGVGFPPTYPANQPQGTWNVVWAQRAQLTDFGWTTNEVPVEACAELCKEVQAIAGHPIIPWVCVPYNAPDDYVKGVVQIFKDYGFSVIKLEHSNELWNTGPVYQGNRIRNDALAAGTYGTTDPNVAGARRDGEITTRMGSAARSVLPGVQIIIAGQATWSAWLNDAASYMPPGSAQVGAVAPYFQPVASSGTLDGTLTSCDTWITSTLDPGLRDNAAICVAKGLSFEGYEAGQSLVSQNPGQLPDISYYFPSQAQLTAYNSDIMTMAQFDPRMATLYTKLYTTCQNRGMKLCCHFMALGPWGKSGYWGLVQMTNEGPNPKTNATAAWIAANN